MAGDKKNYDVVVIGGGAAGFSAAEAANRFGVSVCIIEAQNLGGECPNEACIPTKTLLRSAKAYYHAKNDLPALGIRAEKISFRFSDIIRRRIDVVNTLTGNGRRLHLIADRLGIDIIDGYAGFLDEKTVHVGKTMIQGKAFVLATGSVSFIPPIAGLTENGFLSYQDASRLPTLPKRIAIIGGGPVGCEFATFFGMLGSKVTILQIGKTILEREDAEISSAAKSSLEKIGITILTATKTLSVVKSGTKKRITFQEAGKARKTLAVDHVLLASGKIPNVEGLDLPKSIRLNEKRRLLVNENLQTSLKHIFSAGDISGGMQFTHIAEREGAIAGENAARIALRKSRLLNRNTEIVPRVTFVEPEIASVGMTEKEAKAEKRSYVISKFPIKALGRALTDGKGEGFLKLIVEKESRRILGAHMIGPHAGEVIHEIVLAMHLHASVDDLSAILHAFPTYSEAVGAASAQI